MTTSLGDRIAFGHRESGIAKITDDVDVLLAFYDYPAEHWIQLRTTNPIESTFAVMSLSVVVITASAR